MIDFAGEMEGREDDAYWQALHMLDSPDDWPEEFYPEPDAIPPF